MEIIKRRYEGKYILYSPDLKTVYRATTVEQAEEALTEFEKTWDSRYPMIGKSWRANWSRVIPFFAYSEEIRKVIYTTNAIESLNNSLRKVTKNRNSFPSDEAAIKLLYMALKNIQKKMDHAHSKLEPGPSTVIYSL